MKPPRHWYCVLVTTLFVCICFIALIHLLFYANQPEECKIPLSECETTTLPSRVECRQAEEALAKYPFTQGCLYHNIYFIKGKPALYFRNMSSSHQSFDTMKNRDDFVDHFRPEKLVFLSAKELCRAHCIKFYDDINVLGDIWLGNIGHTLHDSMYAIFAGLIEYSGMHLLPFRIINTRTQRDVPWIHDIVNTAAPLGLVYSSEFFHQQGIDVLHLRTLLVPNYARCISCISSNRYYAIPMGYELDVFWLIRQHMLARFALPPSPARLSQPHGSLRAVAVHNKRFSPGDYLAITQALEDALPVVSGQLVDWRDLPDFRAQLELISGTQIHLSAPGTGMMYQPFLPDGAIHVNLGSCALFPFQVSLWGRLMSLIYPGYSKPSPGFMEQAMVASTPYHRALYYPIAEVCAGLTRERLRSLIAHAAALYDSGFEIPVPRGVNLSPDGFVAQGLLLADPLFREHLTDPVAHKDCATGKYFWPEIVVRQVGGWATGECRLNTTLLTELKLAYNISY
jgi:hypothetical protein